MDFAGGSVPLPGALTLSGMSGPTRVHAPEQPASMARMSDRALARLADNLATLMEQMATDERKPGGVSPSLREYVELLELQVTTELMRRMEVER